MPRGNSVRRPERRETNAPEELVTVTSKTGQNSPGGWVEQGDQYELPRRQAERLAKAQLVDLGETDGSGYADVRTEAYLDSHAEKKEIEAEVKKAREEATASIKGAKLEEIEGQAGLAAYDSGSSLTFRNSQTEAERKLALEEGTSSISSEGSAEGSSGAGGTKDRQAGEGAGGYERKDRKASQRKSRSKDEKEKDEKDKE